MKYTWYYGIFHWVVHYIITFALVASSGFRLVNFVVPVTLFGYTFQSNVADHVIVYIIISLLDLDHFTVYRKFGRKGIFVFANQRISYPLHNFFFLSLFAIVSAFTAIFGLKTISIILFAIVLHLGWDIFEDVAIFKRSYRKWEKTWGLKTKELEKMWNEMQKSMKKK